MASVRPDPALRSRALQSVFPGLQLPGAPVATSPVAPAPPVNNRANAMANPTPNHISAANRAAMAVAAHLASNPARPATPYVPHTRANTPLAQSAGTRNTNYVNSARAQGYNNILPPPNSARTNQAFIPTAQQARQNIFAIPPVPPVPQPTPQVPVPQPTFPPRNNFLNTLFPPK